MPFARHVACTVEMLSTEKRLDVVVIDEIQMIGDRQRGAAWTRALLGAVEHPPRGTGAVRYMWNRNDRYPWSPGKLSSWLPVA